MSSAREACLLASCKHCVEKIGNFDLETLSDTEVCKIQFNPTENFLPVTFVTSVVVITIQINMSYGIGGLMTQAHSALRFDCQLIDTSGSTDPHAKCRWPRWDPKQQTAMRAVYQSNYEATSESSDRVRMTPTYESEAARINWFSHSGLLGKLPNCAA